MQETKDLKGAQKYEEHRSEDRTRDRQDSDWRCHRPRGSVSASSGHCVALIGKGEQRDMSESTIAVQASTAGAKMKQGFAHVMQSIAGLFKALHAILAVIGLTAIVLYFAGFIDILPKPHETNHIEVTNVQIEQRLSKISELATFMDEYTGEKAVSDTREVLGFDIPGTTNSYRVLYSGVIKVGYDVSDITVRVDNRNQIIHIYLPNAQVLDNYIKFDTLQVIDQKNNILNPFEFKDFQAGFTDIEESQLQSAKEAGIFVRAEASAETLIENCLLSAFPDYKVVFE